MYRCLIIVVAILCLGIVLFYYFMAKPELDASRRSDISGELFRLYHQYYSDQFDFEEYGFSKREIEEFIIYSKRILIQKKEVEIGVIRLSRGKETQKLCYAYDPYFSEIRIVAFLTLYHSESHIGDFKSAMEAIIIFARKYAKEHEDEDVW